VVHIPVNKEYFKEHRYRNIEGIHQIVRDGLCHRCGACIGFCPVGTIGLTKNAYPTKIADCIDCNICVQSCSGVSVDYPAIGKQFFDDSYDYNRPDTKMGEVQRAYIAHASDKEIRSGAASGGAVTQIFDFLISSGRIKGAIVAIEDPEEPARGKGLIARNRSDLLISQQSRYTTTPHLHVLNEIKDDDGPFALVGLPCQIHALRKRQMIDPRWRKRIPFTIGLYCHFNNPMESVREAGQLLAPKGHKLVHTNFRARDHRGWPANTLEMTFSDGSKWRSPHGPAQIFNIVTRLSKLGRCLKCLDATAEFADLSVGDPWIRDNHGNWKYDEPEGWSSMLVRTSRGQEIVDLAVQQQKLIVKEIPKNEIEAGQWHMMTEKKIRTVFRLRAQKRLGWKIPDYPMTLPKTDLKTNITEITFWFMRIIPALGFIRPSLFKLLVGPFGVYLVSRRVKKRQRLAKKNK